MPVDPGTATLVTGGLSALTGFLGSGMSNKSVKRSIKAAKEINQINNEFNASEALKIVIFRPLNAKPRNNGIWTNGIVKCI